MEWKEIFFIQQLFPKKIETQILEAYSELCQNIWGGVFQTNSLRLSAVYYFGKETPS